MEENREVIKIIGKSDKKKWLWECPIDNCLGKGVHPTTKRKAWKNGLQHLRYVHKLYHKDGCRPKIVESKDVKRISTKNRKAMWVCPFDSCRSHGKHAMSKSKALKCGREHMQTMHGIEEDPIIVEIWRNDMNTLSEQKIKKDLIDKANKKQLLSPVK